MIYQHRADISMSTLYVVATPIGNFRDISFRAISVLQDVDLVAAEDTRRTGLLLQHFGINANLLALHDHNEQRKIDFLLRKLQKGLSIALVSDAGTPLINDPGYLLVRSCCKAGIRVVPLPGACAAICALSVSGLTSNRFCYEGFLPVKRKLRLDYLQSLGKESRTLIFYESTHRLLSTLKDMLIVWGPARYVVLARELTKIWESVHGAIVEELLVWVQKDVVRRRGEITLIVEGYHEVAALSPEALRTMALLMAEFPLKKAAELTSKIHSVKKNVLYRYALEKK